MNFFKKLFSRPETENQKQAVSASEENQIKEVFTEDYFNNRYTLQDLNEDPIVLDGCLKMVESYFLDNKIERRVALPVNHPSNLDQTMDDGFGFKLYCQAFQLEEKQAIYFLAVAFSDFLMKEFDFKLYQDSQPEYPLRGMTLKYDKDGVLLSLYPYEYAAKVLNYEAGFESLYEKIKANLGNLPSKEDFFNQFKAE